MSSARTRSWVALDAAVAALVALVVYVLHGFNSSLDRDQATFVYGGQQFAQGVPPYRGIFNSVGPLGDLTAGLGILLGHLVGAGDVLAARLIYLFASVACVAAVSVLAWEVLGSRVAALVAPAAFLTFTSFLKLATGGPREKTVMVLCLTIGLVLMLRRRWFAAGVLTALATLTWQPVILAAATAAAVAVFTSTSRLRAAAAYVAGGVVMTGLMAGYFLAAGDLHLAFWGFYTVNAGYQHQPSILETWRLITDDFGASLVVVIVGWLSSVVIASVALLRSRRAGVISDVDRALLVLGSGALAGGLWSAYDINGGADLFVVLPFAAVGVATALVTTTAHLGARSRRGLVAGVVAVAVVYAGLESVATRDHRLPAERRDVRLVTGALPPGSSVMSVYAPEVMVMLGRRNPYPWQLTGSAIAAFLDDHLEGGLAGYADSIARRHPALIAVGRRATTTWLQPVLDENYTRVGAGDHWAWYAAKSLGHARLHRLREADRLARGR